MRKLYFQFLTTSVVFLSIISASMQVNAQNDPFITEWSIPAGTSAITIPAFGSGTGYTISWSGVATGSASGQLSPYTISGLTEGTLMVQISDKLDHIDMNYTTDYDQLSKVVQWGDIHWTTMTYAFFACHNFDITATDVPDLSAVTNMSKMFVDCTSFIGNNSMNNWDVSTVTNMEGMFSGAQLFNSDISNWDVSNVTTMRQMFEVCFSFNQPIGSWNVGKVTLMDWMFSSCSAFNQPIGNWDVSKVIYMTSMFNNATSFNQDINNWNVGNVIDMSAMFADAHSFDSPIGNWNVSKVTDMSAMFWIASIFNQPIGDWDVSSVTDMGGMFEEASIFNQPLSNWDVSQVKYMTRMFSYDAAFNQPIGNWNMSSLIHTGGMFAGATAFNQDISGWDVSKVENLAGMFSETSYFNQDISGWDVSKAEHISGMFEYASAFNQNLGSWDFTSIDPLYNSLEGFFDYSGMSCENLGLTIQGWNLNPQTPDNFNLGVENVTVSPGYVSDVVNLHDNKGWTFSTYPMPACAPLPVNFLSFTTIQNPENKSSALLNWQTASEVNSNYFKVMRSYDMKVWDEIGQVKSSGNSQVAKKYEFIDNKPSAINYYRLEEVGWDGSLTQSKIRMLTFGNKVDGGITIYPNPAKDYLWVKVSGTRGYKIMNAAGVIMSSGIIHSDSERLDISALKKGLYLIQIGETIEKFIVE